MLTRPQPGTFVPRPITPSRLYPPTNGAPISVWYHRELIPDGGDADPVLVYRPQLRLSQYHQELIPGGGVATLDVRATLTGLRPEMFAWPPTRPDDHHSRLAALLDAHAGSVIPPTIICSLPFCSKRTRKVQYLPGKSAARRSA